jgi:hypothetical protein
VLETIQSDKLSDYAVFKLKQAHPQYTVFLCLFQTLLFAVRILVGIKDAGIPLPLRIVFCVNCVVPLLGWAYIYSLKEYVPSDVLNAKGKRIMMLGDAMLIIQSLAMGTLLLTWISTYDDCESTRCGANLPDKTLPLAMVLFCVVGNIAAPLFYTCHHVFSSLLSIVIPYSALVAVGFMAHLNALDLVGLFGLGIIMFYVRVLYQKKLFSNYSNSASLESTLRMKVTSENQEYLMKIQTEDMRHMIGE